MKKNITLIAMLLVATLMALPVFAGEAEDVVYKVEDKSIAFRVKNGYSTEKVQVVIPNGDNANCYVLIGSTSNALDLSGDTDTIAEIETAVEAFTNSSGKAKLTVDVDCSLDADSTDDELLDTQDVTIAPGDWGNIVWDTSEIKHWSVYIPGDTSLGMPFGRKRIKEIYGNIGGTGNITLNIYANQTEKWEHVIVSPVYILGSVTNGQATTSITTDDEVGPAQLSIPLDFPIGRDENVQIRAARASTATTGSLGARVESQ